MIFTFMYEFGFIKQADLAGMENHNDRAIQLNQNSQAHNNIYIVVATCSVKIKNATKSMLAVVSDLHNLLLTEA